MRTGGRDDGVVGRGRATLGGALRWLVTLLASAGLAAVGLVADPAPGTAYAASCDSGTGVTVVVDFTALGGDVEVGCAPGDPGSGLEALTDAGFAVTGTLRWGLAFVCRIDGLPTAETEACVTTPPATAYWSYWHAESGGDWSYSTLGVSAYDPEVGAVEGWAFGSGDEPSITPP